MKKYKNLKRTLQREMRNAYWKYIEKMIFDLPVEEPDDNIRQKQPKNLFTYKCTSKVWKTTTQALPHLERMEK